MEKIDVLHNIAQRANLKNRSVSLNYFVDNDGAIHLKDEETDKPIEVQTATVINPNICHVCGDIVTVGYAWRCRQCVLQERYS